MAANPTSFIGASHATYIDRLFRQFAAVREWRLQPFGLQVSRQCPQSPLTLFHVCRRWRYAVEDVSELWSRLCIRNPHTQGHAELVKRWLHRAKGWPLFLVVSVYSSRSQFCPPAVFMSPLLEQLPQWKEIDLRLSMPCIEWLYRHFTRTGCLKQSLLLSSVTLAYSTIGTTLSYDQEFFIKRLWRLFSLPRISPSTNFGGLTSIQGIELPLDWLIFVLAQCPLLEDISAPVLMPHQSDADWVLAGERRTTLPRLRSANFVFDPHPHASRIRILSRLLLPSLSKLYIMSARGNFFVSPQDLRDFVLESGCLLTSLRIDCENIPSPSSLEDLLRPALPLLGQLESLEITVGLTDQFFGELLWSRNPVTGLFGLRHFSVPLSTPFSRGMARSERQVRITDPRVLS